MSLELHDLSMGYPGRLVLTGISLAVQPGEVLAVVGPNGVGKTTLVKACSGILPLAAGRVLVDGLNLEQLSIESRAKHIAAVPQATQVPPYFTARQVVGMGRTPYLGWLTRERESDHEAVTTAMIRTSVIEFADRPVGELSGGEAQRVLIARALAQGPSVLLLDEPTAHLDLRHQDETLNLIHTLADEERLSVLMALHDLNLVARFADRVALLSDGRIRAQGEPRQVLTPEALASAYGIEIHVMDHPIHGTPLILSG